MKKTLFLSGLLGVFVPFAFCEQLQQEVVLNESISLQDEIHLPTGRHVFADLWECDFCHYTDNIEAILREAAHKAGATVLHIHVEKFLFVNVNGVLVQGMTAVVVLSESHITIHTWPENAYVACDIFTCGTNALPEKGLDVLIEHFKPKRTNIRILGRGDAADNN